MSAKPPPGFEAEENPEAEADTSEPGLLEPVGDGVEDEEEDEVLRNELLRLGVSPPQIKILSKAGIGYEALRLMPIEALKSELGCSTSDANKIISGVSVEVDLALARALSEESVGDGVDTELTEETVNKVLGYPIDTFQQKALKVITNTGMDLLAMAPTGSGKTAVALMGILQVS